MIVNIFYNCLVVLQLSFGVIYGVCFAFNLLKPEYLEIYQQFGVLIPWTIYVMMVFMLECVTIFYLRNMATIYINIMNQHYKLNGKKLIFFINFLGIWIMMSNARYYVFKSVIDLVGLTRDDPKYFF